MKKLLYMSGGSLLLLLALIAGAVFASPILASAHGTATTPTTTPTTHKTTKKHTCGHQHPLQAFTKNYSSELVAQVAPQIHLSTTQLTQKLQSGESLVKIAKAQGVSRDSLKAILIKSTDTVIANALNTGKINQTKATHLKTLVQKHPFVIAHALHHHYHTKK